MKRIALSFVFVFLMAVNAFAGTVFQDNMESGVGGWTATGLWHRATGADPCPNAHSGAASWYYGNASCNFNTGVTNSGSLTSQTIAIPAASGVAQLSFWYYYETEETGTSYDRRYIQISVNGGPYTNLTQLSGDTMNAWHQKTIDLTAHAGHNVNIRFFFDTRDHVDNDYKGWYIDDVLVYTATVPYAFESTDYNWIEISGTGTNTGIDCDDCIVFAPIGFNFIFFGNTYSSIGIGSNGLLVPGGGTDDYINQNIPNSDGPNNYIAPFWDDLLVESGSGSAVYYQTIGSAPNRKLIVQYNNVDFFDLDDGNLYFQVIISEADGSITYQYKDMLSVDSDMGGGSEATIGIENSGGTNGLKYSYDTVSVTNNMAIKIISTGADGDGLPDAWELLYGTDPNDPNSPVLADDIDGDGLNWLQEYQNKTNPLNPDTDGDTVNDGDEVALGTNPALREPTTVVTFAGPGSAFGTAYFQFNVSSPDRTTQGFRVYYGAQSGATIDDYDASFDINNTTARDGIIDQKWGMQGVPIVYFRVAPIKTFGGREFVGTPSNELSTYFAGANGKPAATGNPIAQNNSTQDEIKDQCFIATAAYGSQYQAPVTWLRSFKDEYLLTNKAGRWFVKTYYQISPPIAEFVSRHEWAKIIVKTGLMPAVGASYLLIEASMPERAVAAVLLLIAFAWAGALLVRRRKPHSI